MPQISPIQKLWGSPVPGGHQEWPEYHSVGGFGDPCLAIFSNSDPPLPKGEATYNQWEGLWEGIMQLFKGTAANMVRFLGLTPSVKTILDKLDSPYRLVSTFDVMMQGFYREFQGRSESVACYAARLEGKLNEI